MTPFIRYGQTPPAPASALVYQNIIRIMAKGPAEAHIAACSVKQLEAAVKFTSCLPFVNPSRASPDLVVSEGGKICFNGENSNKGKNAVFLTSGLIVESSLKIPADSTITPGYQVQNLCP